MSKIKTLTHRGVCGLFLCLVRYGRIHMNESQEVETKWGSQSAKKPSIPHTGYQYQRLQTVTYSDSSVIVCI